MLPLIFLLYRYHWEATAAGACQTMRLPDQSVHTRAEMKMDKAKVAVAVKSEAASAKPSINIKDTEVDAIKDNKMEMVSTCVNILRAVVGVFVTVGPTVNFLFPFMPFKRGYLLQIKNPHGYSHTFVPRQLA